MVAPSGLLTSPFKSEPSHHNADEGTSTEADAPVLNEQQSQSYDPPVAEDTDNKPAEGQNRGIVSAIGSTFATWVDAERFENMFS